MKFYEAGYYFIIFHKSQQNYVLKLRKLCLGLIAYCKLTGIITRFSLQKSQFNVSFTYLIHSSMYHIVVCIVVAPRPSNEAFVTRRLPLMQYGVKIFWSFISFYTFYKWYGRFSKLPKRYIQTKCNRLKSQNVRFNFDSIKFLIALCATYTEDKAVCMCRLIFVMQLIDVRKIIRMWCFLIVLCKDY